MVDKEALKEGLLKRLAEARAERERDLAHPRECRCGGHGTVPMAQFSCGYVRCDGVSGEGEPSRLENGGCREG